LSPSRRRVLLGLGLAAASPVLNPSLLDRSRRTAGAPLQVGVVLPPYADRGWLNGLRLALADAPAVELRLERASGLGSDIAATAQQLAAQGVPLVIGAATPAWSARIGAALGGSDTLFLAVEPGAHLARPEDFHPAVFRHTLHLWQAHCAAGACAVRERGRRAALLASYRESGYDTLTAFAVGVDVAGGTLVDSRIAGVPGRERTVAECAAGLACAAPDFVYVAADHAEANALLADISGGIAAPFAAAAPAEAGFRESYRQRWAAAPDALALLGFETGRLLSAVAATPGTLRDALRTARFESPRGALAMDARSQGTQAVAYVDRGGAVLSQLQPIDESAILAHPAWRSAQSGWSVPYAS
jgi:hypothetical protein